VPFPKILLAAIGLLFACEQAVRAPPRVELYIDGTLAGPAPAIDFPDTPTDGEGIAAQIEFRNLGPGVLVLTGSPPILLERDDRLAFRVSQPPKNRFAAGESFVVSVVFAPHFPGSSAARLLIHVDGLEAPLLVALTGEGVPGAAPLLIATLDGAPLGARYDFGAVPILESREANLRLANGGTGLLDLGLAPATLSGPDAGAFQLGLLTATTLGEGEHVDLALSFTPTECKGYAAALTLPGPADGPIDLPVTGRGGDNPQGHAGVTDANLLDTADLDVALSSSLGGARRFAVGNPTAQSYSGEVALFTWDGCALSPPRRISAASAGLTAQLFGAQVALSDDGSTLLVTAREGERDAWIFAINADNEPRFLATLATFDEGPGHGRGAALAGDGSAAFIGQALADSGFNPHGAVFVYERPTAGWQSAPEALFRLVPSAPTQVELVGSSVEASKSGDVVVSGALETPAGAMTKGPAVVFVWLATVGPSTHERLWGREMVGGEPNQRAESVRLLSARVPSDGAPRVAISADGQTIALTTAGERDVQVRLYVRTGDTWGKPTASPDERLPTGTITFTASAALRVALGPAGEFLIAADQGGARDLVRPSGGWKDESPTLRTWNVPFYGALAVAPEGAVFTGMDKAGSAWFVFR